MQVNSSNGSLQQRFFSGTGSIGGIHLPDFNDKYIFSKKKSGVSDKEYRKQIREQAYEDFEKGQFQNKSEGFNRLMKSYTSEVSPDRKGLLLPAESYFKEQTECAEANRFCGNTA
mgnify:CR=1 FL=1